MVCNIFSWPFGYLTFCPLFRLPFSYKPFSIRLLLAIRLPEMSKKWMRNVHQGLSVCWKQCNLPIFDHILQSRILSGLVSISELVSGNDDTAFFFGQVQDEQVVIRFDQLCSTEATRLKTNFWHAIYWETAKHHKSEQWGIWDLTLQNAEGRISRRWYLWWICWNGMLRHSLDTLEGE